MEGRHGQRWDQLMDGAINHFALTGYAEADICSTVKQLIEVPSLLPLFGSLVAVGIQVLTIRPCGLKFVIWCELSAQVYGKDGMMFLKKGDYCVVQDTLFGKHQLLVVPVPG